MRRLMAVLISALVINVGVAVAAGATPLSALPLVEAPAPGHGDTLAVFYSGDGGWAALDRGMAQGLVEAGVPVVGYDSLRYFWTRRSPDEAASDLAAVLRRYMAAWGKSRIVLVGYSFGAGALPAILERLPPDLRSHIRLVALVGVGAAGELRFQVGDWLNHSGAEAYSIAPMLEKLRGLPLACFYGDREKHDACAGFSAGVIRRVGLPGDHHFNGDYQAIVQSIRQVAGF
jgi:type IV secretory pathway VirJ component